MVQKISRKREKLNQEIQLRVESSNWRLDRYIAEHLRDLSRAAVQRLIDDRQILVDGIARKASYRVQADEKISVRIPPPESPKLHAEKIPLDILFENRDLIVINKPAGMVVHPAAGHASHTLVNAILAYSPKLSVGDDDAATRGETRKHSLSTVPRVDAAIERAGIVHRLDRDTSGIIVVAKNDVAMRDLQAQFKSRAVKKTYLALVKGKVSPPRGMIDAPVGRDPKHREKMKVLTRGTRRDAVTVYHTLTVLHPERSRMAAQSKDNAYTLVQAEPQTGRTHQIRVHLAFLGFPVVADEMYGKKQNALGLARQFLHAWKIAFDLPRNGKRVTFIAPLPEDLRQVLDHLGFDLSSLE